MKSRIAWRELSPQITSLNLVVLSATMVVLTFLVQGDAGLNLHDEGFLWYGAIRTALGEVPIRDFQSYDPGRYYWSVIWFKLIGSDGILALRVSQAAFQFLGLTATLLLLRRVLRSWLALFAAGTILLIWLIPPWKIYEPVIAIGATYFAVVILEAPSRRRYLMAGWFTGLAAFFGRNHGVYCCVAFLLLILFQWWKIDRHALVPRLAALSLGMVIGYSPMLLMFAFVPGFFHSYLEGLMFNVRYGITLSLPVPWPWVPHYSALTLKESINQFAIGVTYLVLPAFYLFAGMGLLLKPRIRTHHVLTACTFIGAVYMHYSFSRPQFLYLAWGIPPLIIGLIAVPSSFSERHRRKLAVVVWSSLLILSWTAAEIAPDNYFLIKAKGIVRDNLQRRFHVNVGLEMPEPPFDLVNTDIRGDKLWVPSHVAEVVNKVKAMNDEFIPASEGILIVPYWSAFYPILRKESPVWETYFLFPQPLNKQKAMVEELERRQINWALVWHVRLDNRPELEFQNTHSYVWQYLTANFETVETDRLPRDCELLHRSVPGASPQSGPALRPTPEVGNSTAAPSP